MKKLLAVLLFLLVTLAVAESIPVRAVSNGDGLYPFTRRHDPNMVYGQLVTLRVLDNADKLPGNFGWLTWSGANTTEALAASLTPPGNAPETYVDPGTPENGWTPNPADHDPAIGDWVQGAPGNMNSDEIRAQLDLHIVNKTPMVIPLYDAVAKEGSNAYYRVASYAAFELQSYDFSGSDQIMVGKFLRWISN